MRAYVFTDKSLERYAGRFVWLSIDTEDAKNNAFLKAHPISVWPTLLVLDPKDRVIFRYAGGGTVPQIRKLLDDGEHAFRGTKSKADELLVRADALAGQGKQAEAAKAFDEAIAAAPSAAGSTARRSTARKRRACQGSGQRPRVIGRVVGAARGRSAHRPAYTPTDSRRRPTADAASCRARSQPSPR